MKKDEVYILIRLLFELQKEIEKNLNLKLEQLTYVSNEYLLKSLDISIKESEKEENSIIEAIKITHKLLEDKYREEL